MEKHSETFLQAVRPHWCGLHRVAAQYAPRRQDAADLIQETLLRAWRNFSPTEERTYSRSWWFVILRNIAAEWQRTGRRRTTLFGVPHDELTELAAADPAEPFPALPSMDEQRFREFLDDTVVQALDALEPSFREVIVLSIAGGLTYREIAETLDCPLGTVMSRMARARRMLRERLADFGRARGLAAEERA